MTPPSARDIVDICETWDVTEAGLPGCGELELGLLSVSSEMDAALRGIGGRTGAV